MHINNLKLTALLAIAFCLISSSGWAATTWYVREDGGTDSQCDGTHDHSLAGATGDDCAFNHPYYLRRHGIDDTGTYAGTNRMVAGDTVIVGESDGSGGSTDQFKMGYDSMWAGCYQAGAYGCWLDNFPAGVDSAHKTKIYGRGYDTGCAGNKVQLWGTEKARSILRIIGNTEIQCLEITDHSACMGDGVPGTVDGEDVNCNDSTPPYGTHGQDGVWLSGSGNYLKNVYIHGLPRYGITTNGDFGNNEIETSDVNNNGYGGFSTGIADEGTGKLTFDRTNMEGNGCGERYPLQSATKNSSSNWHHCTSQGQNGAASPDGFAFGNESSSANAGSYEFFGGSYSHNTGDGIDTLHGNANGSIVMSRIRAEGNGGNQIKLNALFNYIENSKLIGNCGFFHGQSFTSTTDNLGNSFAFLDCRANGETISIAVTNNNETYIYGNTILASGYGAILSGDHQGVGCNAGTRISARDNIVYGGYVFPDDSSINGAGGNRRPYFYYASGLDGNGSGTCGDVVMSSQRNLVYLTDSSTTNCGGTGDICLTDPLFEGTIKQGHGSVGSYYQGTDYADQLDLQSGSSAINAGVTVTFQNGSADFNNNARTLPYDMGAVEFDSVAGPFCGDGIINGSEQCDGSALNGQSCASNGYDEGTLGCTSGCVYDFSGCNDFCGNGTIESPEECDGSNLNSNTCVTEGFESGTISCNGCQLNTSACFTDPCGNGTIQSPEECDGTNLNGNTCQTEGFTYGTATCLVDCTLNTSGCSNPSCGNGIVESGEQCDGAALNSKTCTTQGFDSGTLACNGNCTFNTSSCAFNCGNGTIQAPEACDGSNLNSKTCVTQGFDSGTLACNSTCTLNTSGCVNNFCGDGAIGDAESCDGAALNSQTCVTQGFTSGTLACLSNCTFNTSGCVTVTPAVCGNGVIEGNEVCDTAALNSQTCITQGFISGSLSCSSNCAFNTSLCSNAVCGNGIIDSGESCDGAALNSATCTSQGFDSGTLTCANNCTFNTSACAYTQNTNSKMIIGGAIAAGGVGSIQ